MYRNFLSATIACSRRVKKYDRARHAEYFKNILAHYYTLLTLHYEWYLLIGGDVCALKSQGDDKGTAIAEYMRSTGQELESLRNTLIEKKETLLDARVKMIEVKATRYYGTLGSNHYGFIIKMNDEYEQDFFAFRRHDMYKTEADVDYWAWTTTRFWDVKA